MSGHEFHPWWKRLLLIWTSICNSCFTSSQLQDIIYASCGIAVEKCATQVIFYSLLGDSNNFVQPLSCFITITLYKAVCIWRFQFFEMWHCVIRWVFPNVSKDHNVFIMKVRWSFRGEFYPDDEAPWYFKTWVPTQRTTHVSHPRRLESLAAAAALWEPQVTQMCAL